LNLHCEFNGPSVRAQLMAKLLEPTINVETAVEKCSTP